MKPDKNRIDNQLKQKENVIYESFLDKENGTEYEDIAELGDILRQFGF